MTEQIRRRRRVVAATGTRMVRRVEYEAGDVTNDEEVTDTVQVATFDDVEYARVRVHGSVTRNMGDFNSVRVEVMLELPALPEISEIDRAHNIASEWVAARLELELSEAVARDQTDGRSETAQAGTTEDRQGQAGITPQGRRIDV